MRDSGPAFELKECRAVKQVCDKAAANGRRGYCGAAQQPCFGFMDSEVLPEARLPDPPFQLCFGPGVLLICGRIWREGQACAVQVKYPEHRYQLA